MVRPITEPGPISALEESAAQRADRNLETFGWAPGGYSFTCVDCPPGQLLEHRPVGDKRAWRCRDHAIIQMATYLRRAIDDCNANSDALNEAKQTYDKRVTELLRAASREVIKRREINAHRMMLLRLVFKLRDVLRRYARNHRNKAEAMDAENHTMHDPDYYDRMSKAKVNDDLANECEEAILWESPTGDMGTP